MTHSGVLHSAGFAGTSLMSVFDPTFKGEVDASLGRGDGLPMLLRHAGVGSDRRDLRGPLRGR